MEEQGLTERYIRVVMAATTATATRRVERDNVEHIFYLGRGV